MQLMGHILSDTEADMDSVMYGVREEVGFVREGVEIAINT